MKTFCIAALLFFGVTSANAWTEGTIFGAPTGDAKLKKGMFVRYDGQGTLPAINIPPDTWVTIDLTNGPQWEFLKDPTSYQPDIPVDTKAVFLSGLLVITHPGGAITCDLWANFRAPGSALQSGNYQVQTLEAVAGSGVRSNAAVWVPVVDRKFEFYWHYTPGCPSLINLSLQSYVR